MGYTIRDLRDSIFGTEEALLFVSKDLNLIVSWNKLRTDAIISLMCDWLEFSGTISSRKDQLDVCELSRHWYWARVLSNYPKCPWCTFTDLFNLKTLKTLGNLPKMHVFAKLKLKHFPGKIFPIFSITFFFKPLDDFF